MAEKRKRGRNFTLEEKEKLIKLLLNHSGTILNKKTDAVTNEAKSSAWNKLTDSFNANATTEHRTKDSLMKVWEKMKSDGKIYYTSSRRNCTQTGGGPSNFKFDPILEQVTAIMGIGCTGIIGVPDSDQPLSCTVEPQPLHEVEIAGENEVYNIEEAMTNCPMTNCQNEIYDTQEVKETTIQESTEAIPPLWARRRPKLPQKNERSETISSLCDSFKHLNNKKRDIEDLKNQLLAEEIQHKREIHELKIESAKLDIEIKKTFLAQLHNGALNLNLFTSE